MQVLERACSLELHLRGFLDRSSASRRLWLSAERSAVPDFSEIIPANRLVSFRSSTVQAGASEAGVRAAQFSAESRRSLASRRSGDLLAGDFRELGVQHRPAGPDNSGPGRWRPGARRFQGVSSSRSVMVASLRFSV